MQLNYYSKLISIVCQSGANRTDRIWTSVNTHLGISFTIKRSLLNVTYLIDLHFTRNGQWTFRMDAKWTVWTWRILITLNSTHQNENQTKMSLWKWENLLKMTKLAIKQFKQWWFSGQRYPSCSSHEWATNLNCPILCKGQQTNTTNMERVATHFPFFSLVSIE